MISSPPPVSARDIEFRWRGGDLRQEAFRVIYEQVNSKSGSTILIGGPGCAGKTVFAKQVGEILNLRGAATTILQLDCYLKERALRRTADGMISGYDPAAYTLAQAVLDIRALKAGRSVRVAEYDQSNGAKHAGFDLNPATNLIVEGSMALTDSLLPLGDFRVFLDAPEPVLFENRQRREAAMGISAQETEWKYKFLAADYHKYIAPQRRHAMLLAEIDADYRLTKLDACFRFTD